MFVGTYTVSLDEKGRVILPAKFRDDLKDGAYMTQAIDGCLAIRSAAEFEVYARELKEKVQRGAVERTAVRTLMAGGAEATPDRQGRITIPPALRTYAGLRDAVVVTGFLDRIELWNSDRWRQIEAAGSSNLAAAGAGLEDLV
ncbi:MAG: cell division protein MraZ [Acidimicrobiales bacterium]|jgi:MraZ protein|nr:cell division protein MraZ [Acidimicrobiales bacterium]